MNHTLVIPRSPYRRNRKRHTALKRLLSLSLAAALVAIGIIDLLL